MKITAITQQQKLKHRYSIYVDDAYSFSLSESALLDEKLSIGQELTAQDVKRYKKLSADDKAYGLTLAYIARRMRSRWELEDYLRRKGYDEALCLEIMQKVERQGFVNDTAFAESWVQSRRLLKHTSKQRLTQELRQKRVPDEVIQVVLAADETDEQVVLRELIARKQKQTKYQDRTKLMQYLSRQGFRYDDIKRALEYEEEL